jgi:hypothetical protein
VSFKHGQKPTALGSEDRPAHRQYLYLERYRVLLPDSQCAQVLLKLGVEPIGREGAVSR